MKKLVSTLIIVVFLLINLFCITGCNKEEPSSPPTNVNPPYDGGGQIEELSYTAAADQVTALTEVKSGTSDIAVIDSVMANYYLGDNDYKDLQILTGEAFAFASEDYAIGFRKLENDTSMKAWIDYALYSLQQANQIATVAEIYNLEDVIKTIPEKEKPELVEGTDFYTNVYEDKAFTIGITEFAPMAIKGNDAPGTQGYVGFDCELARLVADFLSVELYGDVNTIKYYPSVIKWAEKENELKDCKIDAIWNGFTVTEERKANICFSEPYMVNSQAIIIRKADAEKYASYEGMKKAKFVAEEGSAGESTILEIISAKVFPA